MKSGSVGLPEIYLGGHMQKITLSNGDKAWGFSSLQYVRAAVHKVEEYLVTTKHKLPSKALTPSQTSYRPEIDTMSSIL